MKMKVAVIFSAAICGALLAGGCAKQEVVKKDEPMVPSAAVTPSKAPSQQAQPQASAVQQTPVVHEVINASDAQKAAAVQKDAVAKTNQAEELKNGMEKVYFNFDSTNLSEQTRNTLVKDAGILKKVGKASVRVEGNCDERGSDDYNLALGEKRAKEAVQYLVNLGVPAEQLTVISYGKEKPAAAGHDEASWAKNRRDEFVIVP